MYHIDEENSDVIFEVNGNKVALKIVSSPGEGGGGSSIYLIKVGDTTIPTNKNTYSALRILAEIANNNEILKDIFLRKDKIDSTDYLLRLLGGLEVGEAIDSLIAGKGIIAKANGVLQASRVEIRDSLTVLEVIFNRLSAMESDYSFSESGTIESVTLMDDGTYQLKLRKRWENDFTALAENDVVYGVVNNLASGGGDYYTSWLRVLHVDTSANTINAVMYPDNEVPGGKNYPPEPLMILSHRGNPVNEDRQSYWYLSSREKCICMLDGVTKPILEEYNYAIIAGKLKQLSLFDNLPISYRHSYIHCRGAVIQDLLRVDKQGIPVVSLVDRGNWSAEVAASDKPYSVSSTSADTVWHYGCRWQCLINATLDEPRYGSTGWAMIEGNPNFSIDIESTNGWFLNFDQLDKDGNLIDELTTLEISGQIYNRDVTEHILDIDIEWTRNSENVTEDNAWAVKHADTGKELVIHRDDLGSNFTQIGYCNFKATVLLRDGQKTHSDKMEVAL